ncbi:hypothetical protein AAG906_034676 [Vitis piasezkii]
MEETSRTTSFLLISFPHPISSKLDNHNFLVWRKQILTTLRGHKLQHFLSESSVLPSKFLSSDDKTQNHENPKFQDWEQQDQLIMYWLLASIYNALLIRMVNLRAKVTQFKTQLHNTKKGDLSIIDYLLKIINVVDFFALVDHKISVKDHIDAIFEGLPQDYETFIIFINSRLDPYTVEEIEALLLAQESRIEKNIKIANLSTPSLAHLITTNSSPHFTQNGSPHFYYKADTRNSNFHPPTHLGNGMQHFRGNLSSWKGNNKPQCQLCEKIGTSSPSVKLTTPEMIQDNNWYPDSEATHHFTPNLNNILTKSQFLSSGEVFVGNALPSKKPTVPVSSTSPFVLWHNRLGHPSSHIVSLILNKCNLLHLNKFLSLICFACCMGKIRKSLFLHSTSSYTKPLELVHTNLWGPTSTPSSHGHRYYIHFIDAYSRFTWIYMLKHKSEAFQVFLHFKSQVELQIGHKIKVVQSDWGGEYRSFTQYLTSNGIIHRISSSLPFKYRDEAFHTSVYLINRLPTLVLKNKSPLELKVFCYMCYPNLRPSNHHKLLNHKGYKCLNPNGNILISRDIFFYEHAISSFNSSSTSLPYQTSFPLMIFPSSTSSPTNRPIPPATSNQNAMTDEYLALLRNDTWNLVPPPTDRKLIGCKWVFKVKENPDGTINKYKALLVAKGFHQIAGFDFNETFSPVVKPTTIRIVLTIALNLQWKVRQLDVNNAFLNGDLHEEIFMHQPEGFIDPLNPNYVCKLNKSLYALNKSLELGSKSYMKHLALLVSH